ncbi:choice-of-anchor Q domain-containing protein [Noviherbaspirillum humi]|uniref:choice-of-anchor Q domain-containing protein n=1 Tax=Noviherbaspirillum humi TaxID=1688639 RepID=UPI001FE3833E|nr:choice-of-anchor Q domain-containing protein [Noviherbaspirillum humi]
MLFLNACGGGSNGPEPIDSTANTRDTTAVDSPADIFVATSGSDANSGTLAAPFKTISKASTVAVPGTTVHVAPGEYEGSFKTSASGTGAARIRYIADIPSSVKIVPPENSTDRSAWINEGDYVDIEGFEIDGTNFRGGLAWTSGIYLPGSFSAVKNNRIHDIATDPTLCTNDGGAAVVTDHYYFGTNNDVVGNVIHHIGSVGCDFIHGVYAGTSGMVANNLVYQIGYAAIHLWHDATSIVITNNTVFASTYGILVGGGDFYHSDAPADNIHVSNNIVMDNVFGIKETGFTGIHNTYVNNLLYMNSGLDWELQNDLVHSADVNLDPLFINYLRSGGGDYHLSPGSPAIDKGTSTMSPSTDLDGTRRPQGTSVDIGAYEFK